MKNCIKTYPQNQMNEVQKQGFIVMCIRKENNRTQYCGRQTLIQLE